MAMGGFASRLPDKVIGDPAAVGLVAMNGSDVAVLDLLMHDCEVRRWWPDYHKDDFVGYLNHDRVAPFRIVEAQATVGFLQVYHANCDDFWVNFGVPRETFGVDLAIGHPAARDRGLGRRVLELVIHRLFVWPDVARVQMDPDHENARAIRAFAGAGFVPRGIFPGYDGGKMTYMTVERSFEADSG